MKKKKNQLRGMIANLIEERNITRQFAEMNIPGIIGVLNGDCIDEDAIPTFFEFFCIPEDQQPVYLELFKNRQEKEEQRTDVMPDNLGTLMDYLADIGQDVSKSTLRQFTASEIKETLEYAMAVYSKRHVGGEDVIVPAIPKCLQHKKTSNKRRQPK